MTNEEYLDYISTNLTARELLEQLAEEAAELAQAAMKVCRSLDDSNNPTACSPEAAWGQIDEELVDVLNAYCAVYGNFSAAANALMDCAASPKWARWYERVKGAQKE